MPCPTPCYVPLLCRIVALTSIGTVGFAEAWALARLVFDIHVQVYHPAVVRATLGLTLATAATAFIDGLLLRLDDTHVSKRGCRSSDCEVVRRSPHAHPHGRRRPAGCQLIMHTSMLS